MADRLKTCPFCGGEARTFQVPQNTIAEMEKHPKWEWKNPGMWAVGCDTGNCFGNINNVAMCFFSERAAVKAWNMRASDVVPVVHGQWINIPDKPEWDQKACSVCGDYFCCRNNFCPNCGAKMDGERRDDDGAAD